MNPFANSRLRQRDLSTAQRILTTLNSKNLPGLLPPGASLSLTLQLIDSIRRVNYVRQIPTINISPRRADPLDSMYDPLKAAAYFLGVHNIEEACWQVFLATHFGKHKVEGWRLTKAIAGGLGGNQIWNWIQVQNIQNFTQWFQFNNSTLLAGNYKFGNHRKYESLRQTARRPLNATIESYVNWVQKNGSHKKLIDNAVSNRTSYDAFENLYASMSDVHGFGRTGKFDYLCFLSNLGIAGISPPKVYMSEATGPKDGATLLFGNASEATLLSLATHLQVGMQEMEDALCNWQKSPVAYLRFKG